MLSLKTFWAGIIFLILGWLAGLYQSMQPDIDANGFINDTFVIPFGIFSFIIGAIFLIISIIICFKNRKQNHNQNQ